MGVVLIVFLIYGRPLALLTMARWHTRSKPEFWIVPRPLPDVSIAPSTGRNFTLYEYQFEVPWSDVKQEKHLKNIELVYFSNNLVLTVHDPAQDVNSVSILTGQGTKNEARLRQIFGEETTRSNYGLRSRILNLTPGDLRPSFSRLKMVSSSVLLMLKPIYVGDRQGGLYSFQTEWMRGFQQGDPGRDNTVTIEGFDQHDRELELTVGRMRGAGQRVSQPELNRIIYSLRPVLASEPKWTPHSSRP